MRTVLLSALLSSVALAAPAITSMPDSRETLVNQPWDYAADGGGPTGTGTGALVWSLESTFTLADGGTPVGPATPTITINNRTGQIYFLSTVDGLATLTLGLADETAITASQSFTVAVKQPSAPVITQSVDPQNGQQRPVQLQAQVGAPTSGRFTLTQGGIGLWQVVPPVAGLQLQASNGAWVFNPPAAGQGTSQLTVTTQFGSTTVSLSWSALTGLPQRPTAGFSVSPESIAPRGVVTVTQMATSGVPTDPSFDAKFNFGDGTAASVTETMFTHLFVLPGGYRVRQQVTNSVGQSAETTKVVSVAPPGLTPPMVRIVAQKAFGPAPFDFSAHCDCTVASAAAGGAPITALTWDFGDEILLQQVGDAVAPQTDVTHTYAAPGGFHVRLTAIDQNGLEASDSLFIEVRDGEKRPPFAQLFATVPAGDVPFTTRLEAQFSDPESRVVTRVMTLHDGQVVAGVDSAQVDVRVAGEVTEVLTVTNALGLSTTDRLTLKGTVNGAMPPRLLSRALAKNLTVLRGSAWHYDGDDAPTASGTPRLVWSLGKVVGDAVVNKPEGVRINKDTGKLTFETDATTPDVVPLTIQVTNASKLSAFEDVTITVVSPPPSCSVTPLLPLGALALAFIRRRRRH